MDHSVHKITVYRIVSIALLIVLALLMLFPLYWIITGSVKGAKEINARVPSFFPVSPTTANYAKLFSKPAWTWLLNTVFICGMTMLLACLCGAMGGYALAKKQFAGRGLIFTMFVCAMALALPGQETRIVRGECEGRLLTALEGEGGFGYDPLFLYESGKTFGQMTAEEKNQVSHRFHAVEKMREVLRELF